MGKRYRAHHIAALALDGLHDLLHGIVDQLRIIGLDLDAQFFFLDLFVFFWHELMSFRLFELCSGIDLYFSDLRDHSGADGLSAFADGEALFLFKATGAMSFTVKVTVSPGMTISTPCAKVTSPVTSVVRM